MKIKVKIADKEERKAFALILFTNGYTVRQISNKVNGKTEWVVEYWREDKE